MSKVIFISGGARSGKSRYALTRAVNYRIKVFIATAAPCDKEMKARISAHRRDRDKSFVTIEEQTDLAAAIRSLPHGTRVAVIDCLTVWLANLAHLHGPKQKAFKEIADFLAVVAHPPCNLIVVSNEVGLGIVPGNRLSRNFRDIAGRLNQEVAALADEVVFMISGIPMTIKKNKGRKK